MRAAHTARASCHVRAPGAERGSGTGRARPAPARLPPRLVHPAAFTFSRCRLQILPWEAAQNTGPWKGPGCFAEGHGRCI